MTHLGGEPLAQRLREIAVPGLHEQVFAAVQRHIATGRVLDIGTGEGAFASRLASAGYSVEACDRTRTGFGAPVPFHELNLDTPGWSAAVGVGRYDLVVAVEIIEHLQSPLGFLEEAKLVLAPEGRIVVTTPNVDSLPARVKFLVYGKIRMFDEWGDPTHITPMFWDLVRRVYIPRAKLRFVEASVYPARGFRAGRPMYRILARVLISLLRRNPRLAGDNHIWVLERDTDV